MDACECADVPRGTLYFCSPFTTLGTMAKNEQIEVIARALIVSKGHVLVCGGVKSDYRYLPGGHVEFGEPAGKALLRELHEEAKLTGKVGDLLLVSENAFKGKGGQHHEVNLVFHVELTGKQFRDGTSPPPPVRSAEPELRFEWVTAKQLKRADIRPAEMRDWVLDVLAFAEAVNDPNSPPSRALTLQERLAMSATWQGIRTKRSK